MPLRPDQYDPQTLLDYLEGELDESARAAFETQLRDNAELREWVESMAADRAALRSMDRESAPPGLIDDTQQGLERQMLLGSASGDGPGPERWPGPDAPTTGGGRTRYHMGRWIGYGSLAAALVLAGGVVLATLWPQGPAGPINRFTAFNRPANPTSADRPAEAKPAPAPESRARTKARTGAGGSKEAKAKPRVKSSSPLPDRFHSAASTGSAVQERAAGRRNQWRKEAPPPGRDRAKVQQRQLANHKLNQSLAGDLSSSSTKSATPGPRSQAVAPPPLIAQASPRAAAADTDGLRSTSSATHAPASSFNPLADALTWPRPESPPAAGSDLAPSPLQPSLFGLVNFPTRLVIRAKVPEQARADLLAWAEAHGLQTVETSFSLARSRIRGERADDSAPADSPPSASSSNSFRLTLLVRDEHRLAQLVDHLNIKPGRAASLVTATTPPPSSAGASDPGTARDLAKAAPTQAPDSTGYFQNQASNQKADMDRQDMATEGEDDDGGRLEAFNWQGVLEPVLPLTPIARPSAAEAAGQTRAAGVTHAVTVVIEPSYPTR